MDRIEVLNRVKRPVGFSPREFDETREILRSIWRGEVSASMSGIDEYADLAHLIMTEMTKLRWLYSRLIKDETLPATLFGRLMELSAKRGVSVRVTQWDGEGSWEVKTISPAPAECQNWEGGYKYVMTKAIEWMGAI